jgi:hypothetical protein
LVASLIGKPYTPVEIEQNAFNAKKKKCLVSSPRKNCCGKGREGTDECFQVVGNGKAETTMIAVSEVFGIALHVGRDSTVWSYCVDYVFSVCVSEVSVEVERNVDLRETTDAGRRCPLVILD